MNGQEQGNDFNCSLQQLSLKNAENSFQKVVLEFYQNYCNQKQLLSHPREC